MKKIIINESSEKIIIRAMINETLYGMSDKVLLVKSYLDKNFIKADMNTIDGNGDIGVKNLVIALDKNGVPTKHHLTLVQLFEKLQFKYENLFIDESERDKFLKQLVNDWYFNKISKSGNLSNYY